MSDDVDFDGNEDDSEGIANLRRELKRIKAEHKALAEERDKLAKQARSQNLSKVFEAKGLNPALADLYNGEEMSEDAVGKWAEQYGLAAAAPTAPETPPADDPNAQAAARVNAASFGQDTASVEGAASAAAAEERERMYKTLPLEELVKLGLLPQPQGLFGPAH